MTLLLVCIMACLCNQTGISILDLRYVSVLGGSRGLSAIRPYMSRFILPYLLFLTKAKKNKLRFMQCGSFKTAIMSFCLIFVNNAYVRDYMPLESIPMTLTRETALKKNMCQNYCKNRI